MATLQVFPHCDIHLALNHPATKSINFVVVRVSGSNSPFLLKPATASCTPHFFAPHEAVGNRINKSFVDINVNTGTITAIAVGTNLVILQTPTTYIVVRIQVHQDILAWWFGNESISTAVDNKYAHSQPSIYAMFSDDVGIGTDRVGDITGHGYVSLMSSDPTIFTINNAASKGRLMGLKVGKATLSGSFLGLPDSVNVEVIDYKKSQNIMQGVKVADISKADELHNILFLAEGFIDTEEAKFDKIVAQASNDLFSKPRHEPFATLTSSFNVFKAFTPSKNSSLTCGFQVTDNAVPALGQGRPIPYGKTISKGKYKLSQLIDRVGLPMREESRSMSDLIKLWKTQSLNNFKESKVDEKLVEAWKNCHSLGFLEARDTFFGLSLGSRYADNKSTKRPPLTIPQNDNGSDDLKKFVKRAYEFFSNKRASHGVGMDPRRHAPALLKRGNDSRATSFMTFVGGLQMKASPNQALGNLWVPDGTFKPSRGLIAVIVNEPMDGNTSFNKNTITAIAVNNDRNLDVSYVANNNPDIKKQRRIVPTNIEVDFTSVINTIAHEFGHAFRLRDEYELKVETRKFAENFLDPNDGSANKFDKHDNIVSLEAIFHDANYLTNGSRKIDPNKIKWKAMPRIKLSAILSTALQVNNSKLEVMINSREAGAWEQMRVAEEKVHLRRILIESNGRQLPFSTADADHLVDLTIESVDQSTGKIVLSSASPLVPPPAFPRGSSLFIPFRTESGAVKSVIHEKVLAELTRSNDPLNLETDTSELNKDPDLPRGIPGFTLPCKQASLVGLFEGGATWTGLVYRPSGTCKMRTSQRGEEHGEYCFVCKWLITQRVDPGKHHIVDKKFYPRSKKDK